MKWIIDTDPGIDDAAAMITAINLGLDVIGITVVHGNTPLDCTVRNALRLKELMGHGVLVYAGAERALLEPLRTAAQVHGVDGFGDLDWDTLNSTVEPMHAVDKLIAASKEYARALSILAIGPLTNLALAIAKDRSITQRIHKLVIMGGTSQARGNTTIVGEFNFVADPEAAAIVFESGIPIQLVPWETTLENMIPLSVLTGLSPSPLVARFQQMIKPLANLLNAKLGVSGLILCDLIAASVAVKPEIVLAARPAFVGIETAGKLGRGLCAIDYSGISGREPNVEVCEKVDTSQVISLFTRALVAKDKEKN